MWLKIGAKTTLNGVLLLVLISVFVPLSPKMPAPGLDASWALALNQAVAQKLAFGQDLIFTLGPYSSLYTKAYHPATDFMMIAGCFYLAFSYWLALIFFLKGVNWRWLFALPFFILGLLYARDSLFFFLSAVGRIVVLQTNGEAGKQK